MSHKPLHVLEDDPERVASAPHTPAPGYVRVVDGRTGKVSFIKDPTENDPAYSCVCTDVKVLGLVVALLFAFAFFILWANGIPFEKAMLAIFGGQ